MGRARWYTNTCADAELFVELDKPEYDDGAIISAHVRLVVLRPLAICSLKLVLNCSECLEWCDSDASHYNAHSLVSEPSQLLSLDQTRHVFEPNQYNFHAKFVLPPGLPRLDYFRRLCLGTLETSVDCYLWVPTNLKRATLEAGKAFELKKHHVPWLPTRHTNYLVQAQSALRLVGVRAGGICRMGLEFDRPGLQIDGRTIAKITIDSPKPRAKIKRVQLVLVEQAFFPLGLQSFTLGDSIKQKTRSVPATIWEIPLDAFTAQYK